MSDVMIRTTLLNALEACRSHVRGFIQNRVRHIDDTEDILQDIITELIRADSALQPIENVSAWLYRAARNAMVDRSRKRGEVSFSELDENDDEAFLDEEVAEVLFSQAATPEEAHLQTLIMEELEMALLELTPEQREIFILTEFQGLSYRDITEASGVKQATLLSRKHKAVQHLRERLQALYDSMVS